MGCPGSGSCGGDRLAGPTLAGSPAHDVQCRGAGGGVRHERVAQVPVLEGGGILHAAPVPTGQRFPAQGSQASASQLQVRQFVVFLDP
jgi:hypothetical protein